MLEKKLEISKVKNMKLSLEISLSKAKISEITKFSAFFSSTFQEQKFLSFLVKIYSIFFCP